MMEKCDDDDDDNDDVDDELLWSYE